ncbi:MAG: ABC transporter permease, partial [Thermoanaerobaculia bacterium]
FFPLEIIPIVKVLAQGLHFLFAFPIIILALLFTDHLKVSFLFFFISFFFQLFFLLFLSILIGMLGVFFKDLKDLLSNILHFLFFATPIIYSIEMIPASILKKIILLNPLTHLMRLWQYPLFYGKLPGYKSFLYILAVILIFAILYLIIFKKYKEEIVERV